MTGGLFVDDIRAEADSGIVMQSDLTLAGNLSVGGFFVDFATGNVGIGTGYA